MPASSKGLGPFIHPGTVTQGPEVVSPRHPPPGLPMPVRSVRKLIESVAEVSGERDLEHLRHSLLLTLKEILPVGAAGFVPLKPSQEAVRKADAFIWPAGLLAQRDGILARLAAGETLELDGGDGSLIARAVTEDQALAVHLSRPEPDAESILLALGRLYANFSRLLYESERDRLTGLRNRRSFDHHLHQLSGRMLEGSGERWWLALFDVDHFKRINDGYGHLYGDEVLLLLARIARELFKGEDRCYRYGGEEFAVLLSRGDDTAVEAALQELRGRIEAYPFPQVGRVTISIGCAPLEPRLGPAGAIDHADRALYAAKNAGRNRLVNHQRLVSEHRIDPL